MEALPLAGMSQATAAPGELTHYFISYSRQEVSFADSLARELEKRKLSPWIDFRNLVPGSSWQSQLDAGVAQAKAILLIVSPASMSSEPVKDEWRKSLRQGKRIILIIFEGAEVDDQLAQLEWVDFRQGFAAAMSQLETILAGPPQTMTAPPPQDFRLPPGPKKFHRLTLLALIVPLLLFLSLGLIEFIQEKSFYIIALPMVTWLVISPRIVPLLAQVKKRSYELQKVRTAFLAWAIFNTISCLIAWVMITVLTENSVGGGVLLPLLYLLLLGLVVTGIIFPWMLARRLLGPDMYRWAGPKGVPIRRQIRLPQSLPPQQPIRVALEYAPPDRAIAEEIKVRLKKSGHLYVEDAHEAETILVLLSTYQTASRFDPQSKVLIPVLIQSCHVDPLLSKTQWVDLRLGGRRTIEALTRLVGYPDRLLQTLGVLPLRTEIRPPIVNLLVYLLVLGIFILMVSLGGQIVTGLMGAGSIPLAQESLIGSFLISAFGKQGGVMGALRNVLILIFNFLGLQLLKTRKRSYFLGFPRLGLLITLLLNSIFPALAMLSKELRLWVPR